MLLGRLRAWYHRAFLNHTQGYGYESQESGMVLVNVECHAWNVDDKCGKRWWWLE